MKKNRIIIILTVAVLTVCLGVTGTLAAGRIVKSSSISPETAKKIAFADADVREKEAAVISSEFAGRNGLYVYDIEFETEKGFCRYVINAKTGQVMEKNIPEGTEQSSSAQPSPSDIAEPPAEYISVEDAKDIALKAAGAETALAVFSKAKMKEDDGRAVYEIEFFISGGPEYEFKIDAASGRILDGDVDDDVDDDDLPSYTPSVKPSEDPAKTPEARPSYTPDPEDKDDPDDDDGFPDGDDADATPDDDDPDDDEFRDEYDEPEAAAAGQEDDDDDDSDDDDFDDDESDLDDDEEDDDEEDDDEEGD